MSKRGVHDISLKSLCLIDKPNDVLLAFHFSLLFWIYSMTIRLEYKVWLYFCHTSIKKLSLRINRGLALDNVDVLLKIFNLKSPLWWLVFVSVGLLTLDFLNSFSAFAIVFHKMSCVFFSLFCSNAHKRKLPLCKTYKRMSQSEFFCLFIDSIILRLRYYWTVKIVLLNRSRCCD